MIEVNGLRRCYGDFVAVDDVSFRVEAGEVVGLLGHNGAGKSTIMKMVTGALEPTSGNVAIDGQDLRGHRSTLQKRIGYLPENCPIYPDMMVMDYLDYRAVLQGMSGAKRTQAVRRAVESTALNEKALDPVATLSRGYRQRVGVAQAILHEPDIIILDEPTNGLDPTQIHQMRDLILSLSGHAAVIVSTHILQEVQAICDRVIMLRHGKLALDTQMSELGGADRLLMTIDAAPERAAGLFTELAGVSRLESLGVHGDQHRYAVVTDTDAETLAPMLARHAHEAGCRLYRLEPQARDLETVYSEVNAAA